MGQPAQQQEPPGVQSAMDPVPDCGEESYRGSGRLTGKVAVDHRRRQRHRPRRRHRLRPGGRRRADLLPRARTTTPRTPPSTSRTPAARPSWSAATSPSRSTAGTSSHRAVEEFGRIDVLVSNAAYQMTHETLEEIPDEEWDYTFATNVSAMFHLVQGRPPAHAAGLVDHRQLVGQLRHARRPTLAPYAATKAAIANFSASLAQLLGEQGIRVNSVAPGPIWTPLIPSTMPPEKVENFGEDTPLGRAGQPAELAPVYVLLASDEGSYISGARVAVTGGRPIL